jgi:hypothetical protein
MNFTHSHRLLLGLALPATVALALTAAPAFAQNEGSSPAAEKAPRSLSVVAAEALDGDEGDEGNVKSHTFEIRVDNGDVSVRQNGKEIPDARIVTKDERIIILDENGNEIKNIGLSLFDGPGGYFYRVGAAGSGDGKSLYPRLLSMAGALRGGAVAEAGADGETPKVMIGVHMGEPGPALEKHLHIDAGKCTMITGLFEGLPADEAGIGEYDIIVAVDGSDSAHADAIREALKTREPGETVTLRVIQAGKQKEIKVKLQAYDAHKMQSAKLIGQAPADPIWREALTPLEHWMGDLKDGHLRLPEGMEGQLWLSRPGAEWKGAIPQLDKLDLEGFYGNWQNLQPLIQQQLHEALKKHNLEHGDKDTPADKDVEAQLDRLDDRLSQLETLLEKLIEKQAKP